jgi:hypothetical protein
MLQPVNWVGPIFKTIKVLINSACVGIIFTNDNKHARWE